LHHILEKAGGKCPLKKRRKIKMEGKRKVEAEILIGEHEFIKKVAEKQGCTQAEVVAYFITQGIKSIFKKVDAAVATEKEITKIYEGGGGSC
jgi:hydrogenase maturation factor HypF (carbamoyltransferase family)